MQIFNNVFTVAFASAASAKKAKQIAVKCFRTLRYEFYSSQPSILAAKSLIIKDNILTFDEVCFDSADLMDASCKVLKALAYGLKDESFEFSVYGYDTYTESWVEGNFQGGVLNMTTTYFPEGYSEYLTFPACSEENELFSAAPIIKKEHLVIG